MKIKNILHAAALRFCLLAAAAIAVIAATAAYTATNPQPNTGTVADNLVSVTSFDFNAENVGNLAYGTYYESNKWYYYGDAQDKQETKGGEKCIRWGLSYGIVFKIAEAGEYTLTVSYYNSDKTNGIWVYKGADHEWNFDETKGQSVKQKAGDSNSCGTCTFTITTTEADECWQVSGITTDNEYLHSITLTKNNTTEPEDPEPSTLSPEFPSTIGAINSNTFWYHNGGYGFGSNGASGSFYRYFTQDSDPYSPTTGNLVTINGDDTYGSYEIQSGDAIGFKLAYGNKYRVKIYYYYVEEASDAGYGEQAEAELLTGDVVNNAWTSGSYIKTVIKGDGGSNKNTRLRTYTVEPGNGYNDVYWVKNTNSNKPLYLGGFEILPIDESATIPMQTFSDTWNVEDAKPAAMANIDEKNTPEAHKTVDYAIAPANVVLWGPTMAINSYPIGGKKTVMLNNGSKIGMNLPIGGTLTFSYVADSQDEGICITNEEGTEHLGSETWPGDHSSKVTYTNNTGAAQKIWITGKSSSYAYFSGFEVTGGEVDPTPSIGNATPIDKDYVWYPVARTEVFGNGKYTDNKNNVFVSGDFQTTNNATRYQKYTIHGKDKYFYRASKTTLLGFKIAQGKSGVINLFYIDDDNRILDLHQSSNSTKAIGDTWTVNNIDDNNNKVVKAVQYHFDPTDGVQTYWIDARNDAWFGGFEVLFEEANNGGENLSQNGYTVSTSDYVTNALGTDTHPVFKSVNSNPVGGASMMMYHPGKDDAVAVGGNTNGIIVKMPAGYNFLNVKGYLAGGATINIYKGQPSNNNKSSIQISGSDDVDQTVSLTSLGNVTTNDVYWITSDNVAGAYVSSVKPMTSYDKLQPINVNYIYKVDGKPANGVQGDGLVKFVDQNGSATTDGTPSMNVIGTDVTPVTIENGTDFFGVKVDQGPNNVKTGYVKVYFKGTDPQKDYKIAHKMEELPLDDPMYSGWNSTYDADTHIITFNGGNDGGGRGWWFGNEGEAGVRNLSAYNKINIELGKITGNPNLKLVVQSTNGAGTSFGIDSQGRLIGDLTDQSKWFKSDNGATFDIEKVSQIYIQDIRKEDKEATVTEAKVEIKSARLMNKPVSIATGTNENNPEGGYTEVFGGKIYNLSDGYVYEYPFDLSKQGETITPQLIWITGAGTTGTTNIAAIEVLYDTQHAKVVDWYVNKDTKMIVGSDDPHFTMKDFDGNDLTYPSGYDEYVTFYMSSGRQANVSFIMPEAVAEVHDWETSNDKENSYGKHTIKPSKPDSDIKKYNPMGIKMESEEGITYNRKGASGKINDDGIYETNSIKDNIYSWYGYSYNVPANPSNPEYFDDNFWAATVITATQVKDGKEYKSDSDIETVDDKLGQWKIYMRFVSFKAPSTANNNNTVTVTAGQDNKYTIYYTLDSSDPENYGKLKGEAQKHSSTEEYTTSVDVAGKNCIFKAAQYIDTDCYFYEDIAEGKDSPTSNVLKVVSKDLAVDDGDESVVYVRNKTFGDTDLFNTQDGGYMLTIPTPEEGYYLSEYAINKNGNVVNKTGKELSVKDKDGKEYHFDRNGNLIDEDGNIVDNKDLKDKDGNPLLPSEGVFKYEKNFSENPLMYLTLGGKDHPYLTGNGFNICGTNWFASDDSGLRTYLDSYQKKLDVNSLPNPSGWGSGSQQQNPNTECNGGPGGADTEDGGMFLQPISGTMLRFEPEYDGVITVWLRQNGCLDNNSQENGKFTRRPVYVMDENGRIMRRSTIRPTAEHYMGINGSWAINSSVCEERSQVEHTWLYEVAKQAFANHPVYAKRFADFPNRWETLNHDHSGHILYGWWYKGFDLSATRSMITSAAHVSRFEYMNPELLYRSNNIFDMEMNRLGLEKQFAKYGYELPNFQYVRYRIPVKAGKTYYIAGRGTKNGFSAIRFDALWPNTNITGISDLLYTDNPSVEENDKVDVSSSDYLKLKYGFDDNGKRNYKSTERSKYDLTGKTEDEVLGIYDKEENVTTITIEESGSNTTTINGCIYKNGNDGVKLGITGDDDPGNLVGKTVNVTLNRKFRAYNWHPIILPFSLSETRVEQYFGEGTVILYLDPYAHTVNNKVDETTGKSWASAVSPALEGTKLSFTIHRYQMLYANTPAFICPTFTWSDTKKQPATNNVKPDVSNGSVSRITFKRVTLDGSNSRNFLSDGYIGYPISNEYEVVGSYDMTEHNGDIYYVNNKSVPVTDANPHGTEAQLVHSNGYPVTMKGTRVWIRPRAGVMNAAPILTVGSKGFSDFEEDSESAGISDIVADDYTIEGYDIEDDSVYDLLGRKVGQGSLDGLLKGVYIFQGKKVYVK